MENKVCNIVSEYSVLFYHIKILIAGLTFSPRHVSTPQGLKRLQGECNKSLPLNLWAKQVGNGVISSKNNVLRFYLIIIYNII